MLETEIKKLTAAIEALTAKIEAQQPKTEEPLVESLAASSEAKAEQPKEETPPTITHEEVKELCLKISRADRSKKPAIKALISEYGANVVTQVAVESLAELKAKLEGLV